MRRPPPVIRRGRPAAGETRDPVRRLEVTLPDRVIDRLREVGAGNVSAGIRILADRKRKGD